MRSKTSYVVGNSELETCLEKDSVLHCKDGAVKRELVNQTELCKPIARTIMKNVFLDDDVEVVGIFSHDLS